MISLVSHGTAIPFPGKQPPQGYVSAHPFVQSSTTYSQTTSLLPHSSLHPEIILSLVYPPPSPLQPSQLPKPLHHIPTSPAQHPLNPIPLMKMSKNTNPRSRLSNPLHLNRTPPHPLQTTNIKSSKRRSMHNPNRYFISTTGDILCHDFLYIIQFPLCV